MSLPANWIDKIFVKLTVVYGRDFIGRWEGIELADVKTDWAHELAGFEGSPDSIAYALQHLPDGRPPTVLEFRAIARKAPMPDFKALPVPTVSHERLSAELAKLADVRKAVASTFVDHKAWARRIMARNDAGESMKPVLIRFAREALQMKAVA